MSLVNKMLRDLDARRAGGGDRAALAAAVTPLAAHREPRRNRSRLWFGAFLALVGLGAAVWYGLQWRKPPLAIPVVAGTAGSAPAAGPAPPAPPTAPAIAPAAEPSGAQPMASPAGAALPSLRMSDQLSASPAALPAMTLGAAPLPKVAPVAPNVPERALAGAASSRPPIVAPPDPAEARIDKRIRVPTSAERAESEYRRAVLAQSQGNAEDAAGGYRAALADYPEHAAARLALAALLIDARRFDEAEDLLRQGTELPSVRLVSTLALARLKVERNQASAALDLLQRNAASGERSAEYQGFVGALLNRANRAVEAVERYQAATRLAPTEGRWWAGLGMALDAAGNAAEAREAYLKARALPGLPADLAQHIDQRLR